MRIIFFLLAGIFLFPGYTKGQNVFRGIILNAETGQPIPGANIFFPEIQKGDISGPDGKFYMDKIPDGKLNVQFSYIGFATLVKTIHFRDTLLQKDVRLEPQILMGEEVVVTGGYYSVQDENAVKIETMHIDKIKRSGAAGYLQALAELPGIDMISRSPGITKPVIRGLSMNDVLVLNNGVRVENYQSGVNHPLGMNEFGLEKVEVIKGPASLLYGSDAIGGVINFIHEKPAPVGRVQGDYNLNFNSNTMGFSSDLGLKASVGKIFSGIRMGVKNHADYIQGNGNYAPNTRFNEMSLKAFAGLIENFGVFKLYYNRNASQFGMLVPNMLQGESISKRGRETAQWYQDITNDMIISRNKLFLNRFKLDVNAAYQHNHRNLIEEEDHPSVEMRLQTLSYEVKTYLPSDEFSDLILGVQGMNQQNDNLNQRETIFLPNANISNYAVYLYARRMHWKKFHPQAGLRFDYHTFRSEEMKAKGGHSHGDEEEQGVHEEELLLPALDKSFSNVTASLGLTYYLLPGWLLRANWALGFRAPNLSELTSNGIHAGRFEEGDPGLDPQKSSELDLSTHLHFSHFSFDLAGFYNSIEDYIYLQPTNDTAPLGGGVIYRYQQTNANLWGGEAGFHFHPKKMDWLHLEITYSMVRGQRKGGAFLPFIPADKIKGEIRMDAEIPGFMKKVWFRVGSVSALAQERPSMFEESTSAYTLINTGIGGQISLGFQQMEWGLMVNNLFDVKYYDHLSTLKPLGIYNPGRNISIYLSIPFLIKDS